MTKPQGPEGFRLDETIEQTPSLKSADKELTAMGCELMFPLDGWDASEKNQVLEYRIGQEQRKKAELEATEQADAQNKVSRCTPEEFQDKDAGVRYCKAVMINLYFEYGGNWRKALKDPRSVSSRTLRSYWADDLFRAKIEALQPIIVLEAKGVVIELFRDGVKEEVRLAAALRILEAYEGEVFDRGVRKQIVANRGSIQNTLLARAISDEEYIKGFISDKLNSLTDDAREALKGLLPAPQQTIDVTPQDGVKEPAPSVTKVDETIRVADMSKLTDPFE